jgi:sulfite exporter TauE/SafE
MIGYAFLLGLAASLHCIGMCGPIALSLPFNRFTGLRRYLGILLYNFGRIVSYATLGAIFGFFGKGLYLVGWQQCFSVVTGIVILIVLTMRLFKIKSGKLLPENIFKQRIYKLLGKYFMSLNPLSMLITGIANGLLPCGMVYFALIGAVATGNITRGIAFMSVYGLGTIPLMYALIAVGGIAKFSLRIKLRKATPYLMGGLAILLILRGFNLNIPFISPYFGGSNSAIIHCKPSN